MNVNSNITHNSQKVETTINGGINKMWHIYTMECYLAIRNHEVLIHAITWMNLGNMF